MPNPPGRVALNPGSDQVQGSHPGVKWRRERKRLAGKSIPSPTGEPRGRSQGRLGATQSGPRDPGRRLGAAKKPVFYLQGGGVGLSEGRFGPAPRQLRDRPSRGLQFLTPTTDNVPRGRGGERTGEGTEVGVQASR